MSWKKRARAHSAILVFAVALSCTKSNSSAIKIANGSEVTAVQNTGAFAATAALLDWTKGMTCSGTLIEPRIVMTAAHCIKPGHLPAFVTFDLDVSETAHLVPVAGSWRSDKYNLDGNQTYDWAYVQLAEDAPVQPIQVATDAEETQLVAVGRQILFVGYGITNSGLHDYGKKRKAASSIGSVDPLQFIGALGTDTCQGDSGGPVFGMNSEAEWRVIGITSHGPACSGGGYYGRATLASKWIKTMQASGGNPGTSPTVPGSSVPAPPVPSPTVVPASGSPTADMQLVDDNFFRTDARLGNDYGDPLVGIFNVKDGGVTAGEGRNLSRFIGSHGAAWRDISISSLINTAGVQVLDGVPTRAGVVARMIDQNNYYFAGIEMTTAGRNLVFGKRSNGVLEKIGSVAPASSWGTLRLVMRGNEFRVYWNASLLLWGIDSSISGAGLSGLFIDDYSVRGPTNPLPRIERFQVVADPTGW